MQGVLVKISIDFEEVTMLPIPVKSATHSSRSRPGIPVEAGHLFQ